MLEKYVNLLNYAIDKANCYPFGDNLQYCYHSIAYKLKRAFDEISTHYIDSHERALKHLKWCERLSQFGFVFKIEEWIFWE